MEGGICHLGLLSNDQLGRRMRSAVALSSSRVVVMSFNCWSQARLASILSTSAWVGLTLEPSRLPELTGASGTDGNAPPPTTRTRQSTPLAPLEPTGERSLSRLTSCGRLGSPPGGRTPANPDFLHI